MSPYRDSQSAVYPVIRQIVAQERDQNGWKLRFDCGHTAIEQIEPYSNRATCPTCTRQEAPLQREQQKHSMFRNNVKVGAGMVGCVLGLLAANVSPILTLVVWAFTGFVIWLIDKNAATE